NDFVTTTPAANDFIGFWDTSASGLAKARPKPIVSTGINDLSLADPLDSAWVQASTMVLVDVGSSVRRVRSAYLVAPYIVNISTNTLVDYKTNNVLFNCTSALDISLPDGSDPVQHPSHPFRCEVVANAGGAKVEIVPLTGATIVCSESSPYILKNH